MKRKTLVPVILCLIIWILSGASINTAQEDSYIVAVNTSNVSESSLESVTVFLTSLQEYLQQYDVNLDIVQWHTQDERPEDVIASILIYADNAVPRTKWETVMAVVTASNYLDEISTILENDYYLQLLLNNPDSETLLTALLLYTTGHFSESETVFRTIEDINLERGSIFSYIRNLRILEGNFDDTINYYEQDIWDSRGRFSGVNLAWIYFQLGRVDDAFALMDDAIEGSLIIRETSIDYLLSVRAQLHALNFDYDSAIEDINLAISVAGDDELDNRALAELYTIRGEIIFLIYEWDRVEDNFDTAIELDPTYAPAYFQRGILFYTLIRRDNALADFEMYLELEPDGIYAEETRSYVESIQIEIEALGG